MRSSMGVLLDLSIFTCLSCFTQTLADSIYLLTTAQLQYIRRYPLYGALPILVLALPLNLGCTFFSCMLLYHLLRHKHNDTEMSLVCLFIVSASLVSLIYFFYIYCRGMATISVLDVADLLNFISKCFWASRLISQVSVNWFYYKYTQLHKCFLQFELFSNAGVFLGYYLLGASNVKWYQVPLNGPLLAGAMFTIVPLILLAFQRKVYSHPKYRQSPKELHT